MKTVAIVAIVAGVLVTLVLGIIALAVRSWRPRPVVEELPSEEQMRRDLRDVGLEDMPQVHLLEVWRREQRANPGYGEPT